jgi:hypothetical protein
MRNVKDHGLSSGTRTGRGCHDGRHLHERLPVIGQLARRHQRSQEGTGIACRHSVRPIRLLDHGFSRNGPRTLRLHGMAWRQDVSAGATDQVGS